MNEPWQQSPENQPPEPTEEQQSVPVSSKRSVRTIIIVLAIILVAGAGFFLLKYDVCIKDSPDTVLCGAFPSSLRQWSELLVIPKGNENVAPPPPVDDYDISDGTDAGLDKRWKEEGVAPPPVVIETDQERLERMLAQFTDPETYAPGWLYMSFTPTLSESAAENILKKHRLSIAQWDSELVGALVNVPKGEEVRWAQILIQEEGVTWIEPESFSSAF